MPTLNQMATELQNSIGTLIKTVFKEKEVSYQLDIQGNAIELEFLGEEAEENIGLFVDQCLSREDWGKINNNRIALDEALLTKLQTYLTAHDSNTNHTQPSLSTVTTPPNIPMSIIVIPILMNMTPPQTTATRAPAGINVSGTPRQNASMPPRTQQPSAVPNTGPMTQTATTANHPPLQARRLMPLNVLDTFSPTFLMDLMATPPRTMQPTAESNTARMTQTTTTTNPSSFPAGRMVPLQALFNTNPGSGSTVPPVGRTMENQGPSVANLLLELMNTGPSSNPFMPQQPRIPAHPQGMGFFAITQSRNPSQQPALSMLNAGPSNPSGSTRVSDTEVAARVRMLSSVFATLANPSLPSVASNSSNQSNSRRDDFDPAPGRNF